MMKQRKDLNYKGQMPYHLFYHEKAVAELERLNTNIRKRIVTAIEYRLTKAPEIFGKPLRYSLKGLWSLRVGDFRIVYSIKVKEEEIIILRIGHRRDVYE